jgi:hypothetical protein
MQCVLAKFPLGALDRHPSGQPEPIGTHEGVILDGRNRWHACQKPGVEPKTIEYCGKDLGGVGMEPGTTSFTSWSM